MPPAPYPNRMWADSAVAFHEQPSAGDIVHRQSRMSAVKPRKGRSGPLDFVSVKHRHSVDGQLRISERQDIVYCPRWPPPLKPGLSGAMRGVSMAVPVMLFRHSAMTFNGHRIHYDHPYVTGAEGYAGLIVHGPLQATLLMQAAAEASGSPAIDIEYRGLSTLMARQPARIRRQENRFWLEKSDGLASFEARASRTYCLRIAHDPNPVKQRARQPGTERLSRRRGAGCADAELPARRSAFGLAAAVGPDGRASG